MVVLFNNFKLVAGWGVFPNLLQSFLGMHTEGARQYVVSVVCAFPAEMILTAVHIQLF